MAEESERDALIERLRADGFSEEDIQQAAAAGRLALLPMERVLRRDDARYSAIASASDPDHASAEARSACSRASSGERRTASR